MKTTGVKYMGSKAKFTDEILQKSTPFLENYNKEDCLILDVFTGSTRVAQAYRQKGYKVLTSDIMWASEAYSGAYICNPSPDRKKIKKIIDELNQIDGVEGWITKNYCEVKPKNPKDPTKLVNAFIRKNGMKADAIRDAIESIKSSLEHWEYMTLLTSLLMALDRVQNSQGHSRAFFRNFRVPSSKKDLFLELPPLVGDPKIDSEMKSDIVLFDERGIIVNLDGIFQQQYPVGAHFTGDVLSSQYIDFINLHKRQKTLAYIDPPYTAFAKYNLFYHLWDSIVRWDKPEVGGATNRRVDRINTKDRTPDLDSLWTKKNKAKEAFIDLFKQLDFVDAFVISYSDESLIDHGGMHDIFVEAGFSNIGATYEKTYNRHALSKSGNASAYTKQNAKKTNTEYIFTLER